MDDKLSGTISTADAPDEGAEPDVQPSEDMVDVELPAEPAPGDPAAPVETVNLVGVFTEEEVKKIGQHTIDDYETDKESNVEHIKSFKRIYELYASVMRQKDWPFQGSANINDPILTYVSLQVHGRLYDMLMPAKGNLWNSLPTRANDDTETDRAERTEIFMNWYARSKIPDYRNSYDATIWQTVLFGSTFRNTYWDITEKRLRGEWIGVEDFVVAYTTKSTDPNMSDVPRYTIRRHRDADDIEARIDSGEYKADEEQREKLMTKVVGDEDETDTDMRDTIAKVDGLSPEPGDRFMENPERLVLEQYRKIRMPKAPDRHRAFDGKIHPVLVTIDHATKIVLRIVLREEDDPSDAKRFAQETQAFQQAQQHADVYAQTGGMTPDPTSGQMVPMPPPPEAIQPKPVKQREIPSNITHWGCFQGEGFYYLGFGHFIAPLNEASNALLNQQIDRSTQNNAGGGVISQSIRFQRGAIDRQPGQYTPVDAPPGAMKDAIQNWPMIPADSDGRFFLQHIDGRAGRVSGAGDTLSGEPVGSNETARASMARHEQAQKQISVLSSRMIGYLTCDARIMWRLFSVFLDETEYHDVVDSQEKPRQLQIGRADFIADARVQPTADARLTSRAQRVGEAMDFFQFVCASEAAPELSQNPQIRAAAIKKVLYAMDAHEMIDLLTPQPPPPPPPVPQWQENAGFLQGHDCQVNPADDDDAHLLDIQQFESDPLGGQQLTPTGAKMLDAHRRSHLAQKMTKEHKQHDEQQAALSGSPGPGPGGMAPAPPNGPPGGLPLQ